MAEEMRQLDVLGCTGGLLGGKAFMTGNYKLRNFRIEFGVVLFALLQAAGAAGFYISEVGTPGSLGTAGVANPTNTFAADSAWANLAGMQG